MVSLSEEKWVANFAGQKNYLSAFADHDQRMKMVLPGDGFLLRGMVLPGDAFLLRGLRRRTVV